MPEPLRNQTSSGITSDLCKNNLNECSQNLGINRLWHIRIMAVQMYVSVFVEDSRMVSVFRVVYESDSGSPHVTQ